MTSHTRLQSLIWPEPGLSTERNLYLKLRAGAALSMRAQRVDFMPGARANFGTYYNLFNCGKWHTYCGLETVFLALEGAGHFELTVFYARPEHSRVRLVNEVITLEEGHILDVTPENGFAARGVLFFRLMALGDGHLSGAHWQTNAAPRRNPDLMLSVTTFQREAAVARTVARFTRFAETSPIAEHLHLTVVDNGQSLKIPPATNVTVLPNANLGGSGGFARGLLAAQDRGATHCLFMDDDAAVHMEAIARTWTFLAYASDPNVAVAGAMSNAQYRWELWESGALFHQVCRPLFKGTDLRKLSETLEMEFASTATAPGNFYGGWWYFAFPLAAVRHMPFPFFVRGDDVSFSLVHDFIPVTLPGVISFQEEDFSVKETPLTVYLDLRSHLAHHLALTQMEIGRVGILKIILRFYLRSLVFCHYDTLEAVALALEDVRAGPDFFSQNADVAVRRQEIAALTDMERWRPSEDTSHVPDRVWLSPHLLAPRLLMKCSVNGHLLPGFGLIGNRITLSASKRGAIRPIWGAARLTYQSMDGKRSYTVTHSKRRAWRVTRRIVRQAWAIWRDYGTQRDLWRAGYQAKTQVAFWIKALGLETTDS